MKHISHGCQWVWVKRLYPARVWPLQTVVSQLVRPKITTPRSLKITTRCHTPREIGIIGHKASLLSFCEEKRSQDAANNPRKTRNHWFWKFLVLLNTSMLRCSRINIITVTLPLFPTPARVYPAAAAPGHSNALPGIRPLREPALSTIAVVR